MRMPVVVSTQLPQNAFPPAIDAAGHWHSVTIGDCAMGGPDAIEVSSQCTANLMAKAFADFDIAQLSGIFDMFVLRRSEGAFCVGGNDARTGGQTVMPC